jgi:hypothetical protein
MIGRLPTWNRTPCCTQQRSAPDRSAKGGLTHHRRLSRCHATVPASGSSLGAREIRPRPGLLAGIAIWRSRWPTDGFNLLSVTMETDLAGPLYALALPL